MASLLILVHNRGKVGVGEDVFPSHLHNKNPLAGGLWCASPQLLPQFGLSRRRPVEFNYILPIGNIQEMSL